MNEIKAKEPIPINESTSLCGPDYPLSNYGDYAGTDTPIIIDCGSYQTRAGWGNEADPTIQFDTIVSKYRERKANEGSQSRILVGGQINSNINAKANLKCPFENGILTNPEFMEHIMDYIFLNMGIDSFIDHPIVMTEPIFNPSFSHGILTELLFEAYSVPAASFGVDSLFSYYYNTEDFSTPGLVVSSSHNNTTVIPIFDMKGQLDYSTRINYGGASGASFLLKSMQLKYPSFPVKMNYSHAQSLMHTQTFFSNDYVKDLKTLANVNDIEFFNDLDVTIQFPYVEPPSDVKTQEELELIAQKRKLQAEKLKEKAAKTAANFLISKQRELDEYLDLKRSKKSLGKSAYLQLLQDRDFEDEDDLDLIIRRTEKSIQKAKDRQLGIEEVEEKVVHTFDLIDVPDDELSEDSKREKKKQKLIKAGQEAREKAKKLREEEELKKQQMAEEDERRRSENFDEWLSDLRQQHKFLYDKLHAKRKLRADMTDRRSGASKSRLKSIAKLARDDEDTTTTGRKKKAKTEKEDTFGADDSDWMVYRDIDKEEDSDEEQEAEELAQLELKLIEHDPDFQPLNLDQSPMQYLSSFQHRFLYGTHVTPNELDQINIRHQLHMNVERIRVPEALFQPSILGLGQTGLTETILNIISRLDSSLSLSLIKNIVITGGFSQIPNFDNRLLSELTSNLPIHSKISVNKAKNPVLDSWRGAAKWANNNPFSSQSQFYQTKQQYEEFGSDYTMEHGLMNPYSYNTNN